MDNHNPAIEVSHLTVNYQTAPVLWDIHFQIPSGGHMVAVVGPNGAGKSTLLKVLLGLVSPTSGVVRILGRPFEEVRRRVAYIPQRGDVDWDFPITVLEVVLMGCYGRLPFFRWPSRRDRDRAMAMLQKVGMLSYANRQISQLSGGQQQRVFLARALMQDAEIYFMDEPFAGIDAVSEQEIFILLQHLQKEKKTLVVVHHDLATVERYFDWVVVLNTCLIASGPTAEAFQPETILRAYGANYALLNEAARLKKYQAGLP